MLPVPVSVRDLSDRELEAIVLGGDVGRTGRVPPRRRERLPVCPQHLNPPAAAEWRRVARALQEAGVLSRFDRAALAAYCQAWGRWVEAEERLRETAPLVKTPSGYVQQSPWLTIAHKQLELMGRYMVELGMTPAARSRVMADAPITTRYVPEPLRIERVIVDPAPPETGRGERTGGGG
jgi:P27 family predicted phage terminase small subunit